VAANVRFPRKSTYGRVGLAIEDYSFGCISGETQFFGNTYKLKDPAGEGHTDHFVSTQIFKFVSNRKEYKGTVNINVSVAIQ
jgi:hypothetical protein